MQQAYGVGFPFVGAERVGADELGKRPRLVRLGPADRAHFVEHDGHAGLRQLPSGLASRKAPADHMNFLRHGRTLGLHGLRFQVGTGGWIARVRAWEWLSIGQKGESVFKFGPTSTMICAGAESPGKKIGF